MKEIDFPSIFRAYLECSDEMQALAKKMIEVIFNSEDAQDKIMAINTLEEILFPSEAEEIKDKE